ncbi:holin [Edwardsiella tarda]|uniref:holin n=1 Tax=Edwardsiella tarda TaxID=636 RepID=UPI003F65D774
MFNEHERTLFTLALIGAGSAIGRVLLSEEPITWKLFIGRTLLGCGLSISAAALLIQYPSLSPLAVAGVGAALGVAGYQCVEIYLRRWLRRRDQDKR